MDGENLKIPSAPKIRGSLHCSESIGQNMQACIEERNKSKLVKKILKNTTVIFSAGIYENPCISRFKKQSDNKSSELKNK